MAGSSFFALFDDIATLLDDISLMTKVAAKKTAGVLGDDLALNAEQVSGVRADRELPVVWAVAKGSMLNKAILVPAALLISAFAPWGVTVLLMIGGAYLCFEGGEKLAERWLHDEHAKQQMRAERLRAATGEAIDLVALEKDKVRGAIRTDFVLSAEIIVISLGVVAEQPFLNQVIVLSLIAVAITVGVYGLVGGIVKLDDAGLYLSKRRGVGTIWNALRVLGRGLVAVAPWLMKGLSVIGTIAMFLVGGGILVHAIPLLHHAVQVILPEGVLGSVVEQLSNGTIGIIAGAIVLGAVTAFQKLRGKKPAHD
ncbi:MAG: DUF808 domain-containing protein [Dokdonella sp.]